MLVSVATPAAESSRLVVVQPAIDSNAPPMTSPLTTQRPHPLM
jgi:hypothetical protein